MMIGACHLENLDMIGATADEDGMAAHPPPSAGRDIPGEQCGGEDTETACVPCYLCLRFSPSLSVILRVGGVVVHRTSISLAKPRLILCKLSPQTV